MRAARSSAPFTSIRCGNGRQRANSSRSASKFVEGKSKTPCGRAPAKNQIGHQPRPVTEIIGGDRSPPLDLLDGARSGGHALADVEDDHADGVAPLEIGDLWRLSPLRPRHGQGEQQYGERPQAEQDDVA